MKVLDTNALHKGIDATIEKLTSLQGQMKQVGNDVKGLVALDDSLKGEGGQAIRSFYEEGHIPFLAFFQDFLMQYVTTLKTMKNSLQSLEPAQNGFIRQSFLDQELEQGLERTKQNTIELTNEANAIMNSVEDIISLPRLDDGDFLQGVAQAKTYRNQTIEKLNTFDQQQTAALEPLEQDAQKMNVYIQHIQSMFQKGTLSIGDYQKGQLTEVMNEAFPTGSQLNPNTETSEINACERPPEGEKVKNEEVGGWGGFISTILDFVPVSSNVKAGIESLSGKDLITQQELSELDRGIIAASIIGGPIVKGASKLFKWGGKILPQVPNYMELASQQFNKIKHVLHPDKIKEAINYAYKQAVKPIKKVDRQWREIAQKVLDQPMPFVPQFAFDGFGAATKTVGDVLKDGKDTIFAFAKKVDDKVGDFVGGNKGVAKGTGKGRPDYIIKGEYKLKPNIKYTSKGYDYSTDSIGRIENAKGKLQLGQGKRNNTHQVKAGGKMRVPHPRCGNALMHWGSGTVIKCLSRFLF